MAGQAAESRVDHVVDSLRDARGIPGLAIAVSRDGRVVYAKGFGFANLEHRVPVTPETVFQSGSVGKQFTATAVMQLVADGKLSVDDPVRKYFPEAPASWDPITIRHLLTHTSGLGDYPDDTDFRRDYTEDDLLAMIVRRPLEFAPGAKWRYSNLAYVTLGILIRRVSGKYYGDFLAERIFTPLGMGTRVISERELVPHRAAGYRRQDNRIVNQDWVAPSLNTTADGALYLTVLDLAKWDAGLRGEQVLPARLLEQMWTPVRLNDGTTHPYGFGWAVATRAGRRVVEHGGAWQGFLAHIARYRDDGLAVSVLVNLAARGVDPGDIAHRVAALYLPAAADTTARPGRGR